MTAIRYQHWSGQLKLMGCSQTVAKGTHDRGRGRTVRVRKAPFLRCGRRHRTLVDTPNRPPPPRGLSFPGSNSQMAIANPAVGKTWAYMANVMSAFAWPRPGGGVAIMTGDPTSLRFGRHTRRLVMGVPGRLGERTTNLSRKAFPIRQLMLNTGPAANPGSIGNGRERPDRVQQSAC
jgi:hypothetical protein